jgi:hypothetical protein
MSIWDSPCTASGVLSSNEGVLMLLSIAVEPRRLEAMLELLARLDFPVNPEIFHEVPVVYEYPDGREEPQVATLVEFPAYDVRLPDVRRALEKADFDSNCVQAASMLEEIHSSRAAAGDSPASRSGIPHRLKAGRCKSFTA